MKTFTRFFLIILLLIFISGKSFSQSDFYLTGGGEMIFSFAPNIDNNGTPGNSLVRWTPWFNLQGFGNFDFNDHIGSLFGLSIRNIGYIDDSPDKNNSGLKKKYRSYDFGIPVGLKLGKMGKFFVFGGYEIEFPFHYKEKTYLNNDKIDNKISGWFTGRTNCCLHTVFAGVQLPFGINIKYKYYLTNFFNENYSTIVNGDIYYPYQGKKVNIMYVSISFSLTKNVSTGSSRKKEKNTPQVY
jgi:hypothetical protein